MNLASIEKNIKKAFAGKSELGLSDRRKFSQGFMSRIKKSKVSPGKSLKRIYHKGFRFPYNPLTGSQEEFNFDNPYIWNESAPSEFVIYLKQQMRSNPELHAFYADLGGMTTAEYDISTDALTADDKKVFWSSLVLVHYNAMVYNSRFREFGKFGRKVLCLATFDEYGQAIKKDALFRISELEEALHWERVNVIKKEYESGSKKGKPEDQMKEEIKASRKMMKVTRPYPLGIIRFLEFPMEDEALEPSAVQDIKNKCFSKYERYSGCNKDELEKLEGYLGKKSDTHWDYLELDVTYPLCADKEGTEKALAAYTGREFQPKSDDPVAVKVNTYETLYADYRNTEDAFSEKTVLASVYEYRKMEDAVVYEHYKADLSDNIASITEDVLEKFGDVVQAVNVDLHEDLLEASMDETLASGNIDAGKKVDFTKDIAETEDTAGNGVSVIEDEDIKLIDDEDIQTLLDSDD